MAELNVDIELFPMPRPTDDDPIFNIRQFYANIITYDEDQQNAEFLGLEGAKSRISELMKRIRQKEFMKRVQGKCLFKLSPMSEIGLSFFSTIMPTKKPSAAKVNAVNNKQLKST